MNTMRLTLAVAAATVLAASGFAGPKAGANKGKRPHAVRGVVLALQTADATAKAADLGTITVKIHHHKKKGAAEAAADVERTFAVDANTTFEKVIIAGKGQRQSEPAKFADVQKGEHVAVVAQKGPNPRALKVRIIVRQKKTAARK